MEAVFVKTTLDGRRVEVVDGWVRLGGVREAQSLIPLADHPNQQAIARALPGAAFVAGRLPLTLVEAGVARRALTQAQCAFDASPQALAQRMRQAMWERASAEGVE